MSPSTSDNHLTYLIWTFKICRCWTYQKTLCQSVLTDNKVNIIDVNVEMRERILMSVQKKVKVKVKVEITLITKKTCKKIRKNKQRKCIWKLDLLTKEVVCSIRDRSFFDQWNFDQMVRKFWDFPCFLQSFLPGIEGIICLLFFTSGRVAFVDDPLRETEWV